MTSPLTDIHSKPLTIGLVLDDSLDLTDGVPQHVLILGRWLRGKGHEVHYLTTSTVRSDVPNIHSLSAGVVKRDKRVKRREDISAPRVRPVSQAKLRALFARVQFDVLHVQMPYSPFTSGRIVKAAPESTRIIGTYHALPWDPTGASKAKLQSWFLRKQLQHFAEVFAVSAPSAQFARQTLRINAEVIGNPVRVLGFEQAHAEAAAAFAAHKRSDDQPVRIFFLGRLVENKGLMQLLAAARRLMDITTTPFELVIGGKGPLIDEALTFTATYGLAGVTTFLGYVPEDDKPDMLARADIAVLPAIAGESYGVSLVEALAATTGVVLAGDNPGYRSMMTGLEENLVNVKDTEAFARVLKKYVEDPAARSSMQEKQAEQARLYDVDTIGTRLVKAYLG